MANSCNSALGVCEFDYSNELYIYLSVSNIIHTLGNGLYPFGATRRFPTYINICGFVMLIFNIIFQNDEEEENGFWLLIDLNVFSKLRKKNVTHTFRL